MAREATTTSTVSPQARALVEAFHRSWEDGDLTVLDHVLTPNWRNHPDNPSGGTGPENWKQTVVGLRAVFSKLRYEISEIFEAGDRVVVRGLGHGVHNGPFRAARCDRQTHCVPHA